MIKHSKRVFGLFLFLSMILYLTLLSSQVSKTMSDQWAATDALGRKLPDAAQAGSSREGKYIGLFYWTWHTDFLSEPEVLDITRILKQDPGAETDPASPLWQVQVGGTYW